MNNRARVFASMWNEKWFGFWAEEAELLKMTFSLDNHVDRDWNPAYRARLLDYLRSSPVAIVAQAQKVKCGLCDDQISNSCYRSDGELLWGNSLSHFVEKHAFIIPDIFVAHIRSRNYSPPISLLAPVQNLPWPK